MKKTVSLILAVLFLVSVLPLSLFSVSAETYGGTCGEGITWTLDTDTGILKLEGTGNMQNYSIFEASPWLSYKTLFTKVEIGEGIIHIGDNSFSGLDNVTEIIFPESLEEIGGYAFSGCTGLTELRFSANFKYIDCYAFAGCSNLTFVELPPSLNNINGNAFRNCTLLNTVVNYSDRYLYPGLRNTFGDIAHHAVNVYNIEKPYITMCDDKSVTLSPVDGYEYSIDGINWQSDNVFTGLQPYTAYTFYQRIKEYAGKYSCSEGAEVKTAVLRGDTNISGNINITDALCIFKHISGQAPIDSSCLVIADLNHSGVVNISDALLIFKHIAGIFKISGHVYPR